MKEEYLASNLGQILREVREKRGLSQEELAARSDLDRTYISQLERGKKNPTVQTLLSLCRVLEFSPADFMRRLLSTNSGTEQISVEKDDSLTLPIYGTGISCGRPITDGHVVNDQLIIDDLLVQNKATTFFVRASGESMSPNISDGDFLVIDSSLRPKLGDAVLVQVEGSFCIKRYSKSKGLIVLRSDNPMYRDFYQDEFSEVIYCGVVTSNVRLNP